MTYTVTSADLPEQPVAVVRGHATHEGIGTFLGGAFGRVLHELGSQGTTPTGAPFARYTPHADGGWDVEAGFPVAEPVHANGEVRAASLPGGHVARVLHRGRYDAVGAAYEAAEKWVVENGGRRDGHAWECYLDDPEVEEPRTEVFMPYTEAHR